MADTFARWTSDVQGDLARTWCWQPHDAAIVELPRHAVSAEEIEAAGFDPEEVEWSGEMWSTREAGIPGFEVDGDLSDDEILAAVPATDNVSATAAGAQLVLFEGEYEGEEYEAAISSTAACRFTPSRIVRIIK